MHQVFDDALRDLGDAIATDQLQLFYQPQVTADGRGIAAVEALARWSHPKAGWIPPSTFIPYAERAGLIESLGLWALRRACLDAHLWPRVTVSVNVSPVQFRNRELVRQVMDCLKRYNTPATWIELEITEGAVFEDPAYAENVMIQFREAGI